MKSQNIVHKDIRCPNKACKQIIKIRFEIYGNPNSITARNNYLFNLLIIVANS